MFSKLGWETDFNDPQISLTMRKILESMKRDEKSRIEIKKTFVPEEDNELLALLDEGYDKSKALFAHVHLHKLVKIEDWFKDGTTIVKTLRKGKGRNPFVDSTVKLRLQVQVNGTKILSNYPELEPNLLQEEIKDQPYDFFRSENLKPLTAE